MSFISHIIGKRTQPDPADFMVGYRKAFPFATSPFDERPLNERFQSWDYICAKRNATALSCQPLRAYTNDRSLSKSFRIITDPLRRAHTKLVSAQTNDETVEVPDAQILSVLKNPNPINDGIALLYLTSIYLQMKGTAYWYVRFNRLNQPMQFWPLPSHLMWPVLTDEGEEIVDHYELRYAGIVTEFDADEIVWFRQSSPIDPMTVWSDSDGIRSASEINRRMIEYEHALMENFAVPDNLVIPDEEITSEQAEAAEKRWEALFGGWRKRGKTAFATYKIKEVMRLGMTNRELQFKDSKPQVREEIAAGRGVPLPIITVDGSTFSNMATGLQLWAQFTIDPMGVTIANTLNKTIMPLYGTTGNTFDGTLKPTTWLAFDSAVPDDEEKITQTNVANVQSDIITRDEARSNIGREPHEDGRGSEPLPSLDPSLVGVQPIEDIPDDADTKPDTQEEKPTGDAMGPGVTGPTEITFNELSLGMERAFRVGDLETVNILREEMAVMLGHAIPSPLSSLEGAPSGADTGVVGTDGNDIGDDSNGDGKSDGSAPDKEKAATPSRSKTSACACGQDHNGNGRGGKVPPLRDAGPDPTDGSHDDKAVNDAQTTDEESGGGVLTHDDDEKADECVARWVRELTDAHPDWDHDQVVAVAIDKCDREGKCWRPRTALEEYVFGIYPETSEKLALTRIRKEIRDADFIREVKGLFDEIQKDVVSKLDGVDLPPPDKSAKAGIRDIMAVIFKPSKWTKKLETIADEFLGEALVKGIKLGEIDLARIFAREDVSGEAIDATVSNVTIKKQLEKLVDQFSSKVIDLTGGQLRTIISDGLDAGTTPRKLSVDIAKLFDRKRGPDTDRIARTELSNALNSGAQLSWKESGVVTKNRWLASVDACEFCLKLNGKVRKLGKAFLAKGGVLIGVDGGRMRGNYKTVTGPTLHPHCRCTLIPIADD